MFLLLVRIPSTPGDEWPRETTRDNETVIPLGARTERAGDAGPMIIQLGGKDSPAAFS
jgi:hypothetical protein